MSKQNIVDGVAYPAAETMQAVAAPLVRSAAGKWRPGFVGPGATITLNNLTMYCSPYVAMLPTADGSPKQVFATAQESVTLAARDATYPRRDLLVIRPGTGSTATFTAITGTPAASPARPTAQATDLVISEVYVPTGTGGLSFTDLRTYTAPVNAPIPCTSTTRPATAGLLPGQLIWETDTGLMRVWDGGTWKTAPGDSAFIRLYLPAATTGAAGTNTLTGLAVGTQMGSGLTAGSGQITVSESGLYSVAAQVTWAAYASGSRGFEMRVTDGSGTRNLCSAVHAAPDQNFNSVTNATAEVYVVAGAKIILAALLSGAGQLNVLGGADGAQTWMTVRRVQ